MIFCHRLRPGSSCWPCTCSASCGTHTPGDAPPGVSSLSYSVQQLQCTRLQLMLVSSTAAAHTVPFTRPTILFISCENAILSFSIPPCTAGEVQTPTACADQEQGFCTSLGWHSTGHAPCMGSMIAVISFKKDFGCVKVGRVREDAAGATWQPPGGGLLSRTAGNRPAPVQACHSSTPAHTHQFGSHP